MPTVTRPDDVEIRWEVNGEGPLALVTTQVFANPEAVPGLLEELITDHRVLTYDPRGTGSSTPSGPYDLVTDAGDLGALIEAAGEPAAIIGLGNVGESAVLLAADRPDLVSGVVIPFGNPAGLRASAESSALSGSTSVIEVLKEQLAMDYRAALRSVITTGNPQMTEDEIRNRVQQQVDYCPQEVALARLTAWWESNAFEQARALGNRLTILQHDANPWFPGDLLEPMRELLPQARIEAVEDGHLSRPDLTAAEVRRITADNPN
jgi:pimeloyl-ACP methyl ester carboxylesterase